MNYSGEIRAKVEDFVKNYNGVKKCHVSIKNAKPLSEWHIRDTLIVRAWVDKDLFDAQDVIDILADTGGFEKELSTICRGSVVIQYDIYYV